MNSWKKTFTTIWAGQAVSLLTSAIIQSAIIWHITAQTGSATVLSLASLIGYLPLALFSPFIGSLIDRLNRKTIMIVADLVIAAVSVLLAAADWTGMLSIPVIYAALFVRAVGTAFHAPCLQAVTPLIVPSDKLVKCGGYTYTLQSLSLVLSPAIAAAVYPVLPFGTIIMLDAVGAAAGIFTVAISKIPALPESGEKKELRVLQDSVEGLKRLYQEKGLFFLVLIGSLFSLAYIPVSSLYPLMSMSYFGGTTTHAGIVEIAFSGGMLLGGLVLGLWGGTRNKMVTITVATAVMGLTLVGMGLLPPTGYLIFTALTLVTGFAAPFFSTPFMTIIQQKIPPDFLGRVIGVSSSLMALACPIGLSLSGMFAERVGVTNWFLISAVLTLACMVLCVGLKSVRRLDSDKT